MANANGGVKVFKSESKMMAHPRVFASPIIHNGNIYAVGGCDQMGQPVDNLEMFDSKKKRFTTLQNMPTKRAAPAVGVVGDKIISVGGVGDAQQPVNAVEIYNTADNEWTKLECLPEGLLGISAVIRSERVLAIGGMATDTNPQDFFRSINLEENKWKALTPMPTPRYATFSFLIGEKLYVIGGRQGKEPCLAFEVYDFTEEKWRVLPSVQSKRVFAMYTCTDKYIFSLGGLIQPGNSGFTDVCEIFDLETETWKNGPNMPTKKGDFAVGILEGQVVTAGGLANDGKPLASIEVYDIEAEKWQKAGNMTNSHCSCAHIVYNGKLFVMGGLSAKGPSNVCDIITCSIASEQDSQKGNARNQRGKKKR